MRKLALVVLVVSAAAGGFLGCGGSAPRKVGNSREPPARVAMTAAPRAPAARAARAARAAPRATRPARAARATALAAPRATTAPEARRWRRGRPDGRGRVALAERPEPRRRGHDPRPCSLTARCTRRRSTRLPYTVAQDFKVIHVLSNNDSAGYWKVVGTPDCSDSPTYPPFPSGSTDGGVDGSDAAAEVGTDAGADGGAADGDAADVADETLTLQLDDPDAGDGGVADAAVDAPADAPLDVPASDGSTDGATDVAANDGGADAGPALPACYEFSYDPDGCVGTCWAGVVFEVTDVQGPSGDTKGVCIQTGAMAVEFWARASKNNARVEVRSIVEGNEAYLNITTTWTRYTVAISPSLQQTYNNTAGDMQGVWNAFSAVVEPADHAGGTYIELKDMHWIATP